MYPNALFGEPERIKKTTVLAANNTQSAPKLVESGLQKMMINENYMMDSKQQSNPAYKTMNQALLKKQGMD